MRLCRGQEIRSGCQNGARSYSRMLKRNTEYRIPERKPEVRIQNLGAGRRSITVSAASRTSYHCIIARSITKAVPFLPSSCSVTLWPRPCIRTVFPVERLRVSRIVSGSVSSIKRPPHLPAHLILGVQSGVLKIFRGHIFSQAEVPVLIILK